MFAYCGRSGPGLRGDDRAARTVPPMATLHEQFDDLARVLRTLIGLLEEADEQFWIPYLRRGLRQVE